MCGEGRAAPIATGKVALLHHTSASRWSATTRSAAMHKPQAYRRRSPIVLVSTASRLEKAGAATAHQAATATSHNSMAGAQRVLVHGWTGVR